MQGTLVQFLGQEDRSPGEGKDYPLQYSGLEKESDMAEWLSLSKIKEDLPEEVKFLLKFA